MTDSTPLESSATEPVDGPCPNCGAIIRLGPIPDAHFCASPSSLKGTPRPETAEEWEAIARTNFADYQAANDRIAELESSLTGSATNEIPAEPPPPSTQPETESFAALLDVIMDDYPETAHRLQSLYANQREESLTEMTDPVTGLTVPVRIRTVLESLSSQLERQREEYDRARTIIIKALEALDPVVPWEARNHGESVAQRIEYVKASLERLKADSDLLDELEANSCLSGDCPHWSQHGCYWHLADHLKEVLGRRLSSDNSE